ncbi:helix-turn-helix domain-containing protein [Pontibacter sp. 172403-2]|uniref:helix-turn-helix domain-containing protein n=1 Tax=Pontibacter rufus TaxID=2791028 RepID=UPI0018B005D1|nr:helix-turn-helix domain-containing protein [Pontibacter sp. 172403-2]MBF9253212.1 helix-turn-helix domain-containing protein [Pontibacter sp. 172403-2]
MNFKENEMDKKNLASKIKALRKRKGFSQEQLAEESTLSLRTVQRIENGETVPHGDSLRKLTQALSVNPDEILEWAPTEDRSYLVLLNLAGLGFLFHPLLGVIIPLVMWILKKDKIKLVDDSGKKLISFEITFVLLLYTLVFIFNGGKYLIFDISVMRIVSSLVSKFSIQALLIALLYLFNISLIIVNVKRNQGGLKSRYIPATPFLR